MRSATSKGWNPDWEDIWKKTSGSRYPSENVIRFVAANWYSARSRKKIKILDLGCGPGNNTWYLAREGFSVSAIDGSAAACKTLRKRLAKENLKAEVRTGGVLALPWPADHFDGVIEHACLMHNSFEHSRAALREVRRVLKPNGLLLSVNPSTACWGYGLGTEVEANGFASVSAGPASGLGFTRFMDRKQIDDLYRGFSKVEINRASWTVDQGTHTIEFWLVQGRK